MLKDFLASFSLEKREFSFLLQSPPRTNERRSSSWRRSLSALLLLLLQSQLKHSTGCISNTRRSRGKRRTSLPKKRSLDGEALFPLSKPASEKKLFPRKLSPPLHLVVGGPRKAGGERTMSKNGEKQEGFFPSLFWGLGPESLTPRRPTQPTN